MSPKRKRYQRGDYKSIKSGETYRYRSGWEFAYMQYLDTCHQVKSWSYESFFIEYISNKKTGKTRKYIPDFKVIYLDDSTELIEIKPKRKLNQLMVRKKCDAAEAWCQMNGMAFKIITENELKGLGII